MNNLLEVVKRFPDNKSCREYLERIRWNGNTVCPHCRRSNKIYVLKDFNYKCSACSKKFSVLVGSIFENTKIPLQKWFIAIYLATSHKKGISSLQLSKDIGITQKSAWYMLHRIRQMLKEKAPFMLKNTVEIDETYVGGKNKNRHLHKKVAYSQGRSTKGKTVVLGMLERKGKVIAKPVEDVSSPTLTDEITKHIDQTASVHTDEWLGYSDLKKVYNHQIVKHHAGEYVKGLVHTNIIEGFWSILKRGIIGIYHFISKKHLGRYLDEFSYRYNTKDLSQEERFSISLRQCEGKLPYEKLTASSWNNTQEPK